MLTLRTRCSCVTREAPRLFVTILAGELHSKMAIENFRGELTAAARKVTRGKHDIHSKNTPTNDSLRWHCYYCVCPMPSQVPILNSLSELLTKQVHEQPERIAVGTPDLRTVLSYGQLDTLVRSSAAQLSQLGLSSTLGGRFELGETKQMQSVRTSISLRTRVVCSPRD